MEPIKKLVKQAITQIERERDHFATSYWHANVRY